MYSLSLWSKNLLMQLVESQMR